MTNQGVTIRDIAERLGVSSSLVSIVLSGKGKQKRVKNETIDKVKAMAAEMGYKPNLQARALRTSRSGLLALVVPDISNPFYGRMARMLGELSSAASYELLIGSFDEDEAQFSRLINRFTSLNVEGMVIVPQHSSAAPVKELREKGIPFVFIDRYLSDIEANYVVSDNKAAAMSLTQSLLLRGVKRAAAVTYSFSSTTHSDRIEGFREALSQGGGSHGDNIYQLSLRNMEKEMEEVIVSLIEGKIEGVFFTNNALGIAGLKMLASKGLQIPGDIEVACFDNADSFSLFPGPVHYAEQNMEVICNHAFDILVNMLAGLSVSQKYKVPVRLFTAPE